MEDRVTFQSCALKCFQRHHSLLITKNSSYQREHKYLSRKLICRICTLKGKIGDRKHHYKTDTQIGIHAIGHEKKKTTNKNNKADSNQKQLTYKGLKNCSFPSYKYSCSQYFMNRKNIVLPTHCFH